MCAFANVCVWVEWGRSRGGKRGGLLESDPLTKTLHSIRDLYEYMGTSQAEWEGRSRGEVVSGGRRGEVGGLSLGSGVRRMGGH